MQDKVEMKITTLIENRENKDSQLKFEHGLSLYIEVCDEKILFDTGQTGDFVDNAAFLGKDLDKLDYCIISHGHYDHSGGLKRFLATTKKAPKLLVGEEFFRKKYKLVGEDYKEDGNLFSEEDLLNLQVDIQKITEDITYLSDELMVFKNFLSKVSYEEKNNYFFLKGGENYFIDEFVDEIALGIKTSKGLVVIVGCSHVGVVNILQTIQERTKLPIYAVIGGTHLIRANEERIRKTIQAFQDMDIQLVAVSHCTGDVAVEMIQEKMPQQFVYNNTGNIIEIWRNELGE